MLLCYLPKLEKETKQNPLDKQVQLWSPWWGAFADVLQEAGWQDTGCGDEQRESLSCPPSL